jgi:hypothetical protein
MAKRKSTDNTMAKREVFVLENKKTAWYYTNILH